MPHAKRSAFDVHEAMRPSLEAALAALPTPLERDLDKAVVLATGCAGFFGVWVLAAAEELRRRGSGIQMVVVSRDPQRFWAAHPRWAHVDWVRWIKGDPRDAGRSALGMGVGEITHALHMAASSDAQANAADPLGMVEAIVGGSAALARLCLKARAPMLMVSSGAVYGRGDLPAKEGDESSRAPGCLDPRQAYGEAKRAGEMACACLEGLEWTVARPFAFMGPHLPLASHFAAGNFLADAAAGRAIQIKGDGSPIRSYMGPADMAAWHLWLLARGPRGQAVNVGSADGASLAQCAREIAELAEAPEPQVLGAPSGAAPDVYLPDASRAGALGLRLTSTRQEQARGALAWLRANGGEWGSVL